MRRLSTWKSSAACRKSNPILFDNDDDLPYPGVEVSAICNICIVKADCLNANIRDDYGIWAGTTGFQRQQLRTRRKRRYCPQCTSQAIIKHNGSQICLSCGVSWNIKE